MARGVSRRRPTLSRATRSRFLPRPQAHRRFSGAVLERRHQGATSATHALPVDHARRARAASRQQGSGESRRPRQQPSVLLPQPLGNSHGRCGRTPQTQRARLQPERHGARLYLERLPEYRGKVAVFSSWDLYPYIVNACEGAMCWCIRLGPICPSSAKIIRSKCCGISSRCSRAASHSDILTHHLSTEYLRTAHPRVLHIAYSVTGSSGARRQTTTTTSKPSGTAGPVHRAALDRAPARPEVCGQDHADRHHQPWQRHALSLEGWRYHGGNELLRADGSESDGRRPVPPRIAALGPDTVATGEAASTERITIGRIAATVGALLGEDFGRSGETKKARATDRGPAPEAIRGRVAVAMGIRTCGIKVVRAAACEHQPLFRLCPLRAYLPMGMKGLASERRVEAPVLSVGEAPGAYAEGSCSYGQDPAYRLT